MVVNPFSPKRDSAFKTPGPKRSSKSMNSASIMKFVSPTATKYENNEFKYDLESTVKKEIFDLDQSKNRTRSLGNPLDWEFAKVEDKDDYEEDEEEGKKYIELEMLF
jgi:hypothetical protein